jgi:hypothetical protein
MEGGHWRRDDGARLGRRRHRPQVAEMQRAFAHQQDERPAFLQGHVGGAQQQAVRRRIGDARQAAD